MNDHGVTLHSSFPDDIVQAAAAASKDIMRGLLASGGQRVARSFVVDSMQLLRQRTEGTDLTYLVARQRFLDYSDL